MMVNCFNPPPALGPGETLWLLAVVNEITVSIRPRLWGRGKRPAITGTTSTTEFQSAPGFGAGGNWCIPDSRRRCRRFNPPPALGPGETHRRILASWPDKCFNPPPALGPGETGIKSKRGTARTVSIRPRLWGRGKPL